MYSLDILEKLLNIPSPTGMADDALDFCEEEFKKLGIKTRRTHKRSLIATIEGKDKEDVITFTGHVDTLGLMVKNIREDGRIIFHKIGGYPINTVENEYVKIHSDKKVYDGTVRLNDSSVHVHPKNVESGERTYDTMSIVLDEEVSSKEDVEKLGIQIGDFISLNTRTVFTEAGFIKSRHLDDKAGVASIFGLAEYLKDKTPKRTVHFLISNYEEVGHGATVLPEGTKDLISVDMSAPDTGQSSKEEIVTICALDSSGPYDLVLRKELEKLARENDVQYAIDIYPFYGSDASAALRAGFDIRAGLIGPGVSHSHTLERTHKRGIENTIKLMKAFVER